MKQAGVDVVYFGGLHTEAGLIIRQMRDQGLKAADDVAATASPRDEFASIAGPGAEGTLMTFSPGSAQEPERQGRRSPSSRPRTSSPRPTRSTATPRSQIIAAGGRSRLKSTDAQEDGRRHARRARPFKTVIGDISFDKKGDITRPDYVMYVWKKGADGKIDYSGNEIGM